MKRVALVTAVSVAGFVVFVYGTEFVAAAIWPHQSYETGLSFILLAGLIGAPLSGWLTLRTLRKRPQR
jgi:hypothetical protein